MDYNDNYFQSQHFQLGAEDNNKFPPTLQSYALGKFDLDEPLQGDLRFDSLAETEALLGIRSQEENHWIEDFSHSSSGIEFSSGATESRSISMRNNVWSEATSSESVEMLLKSVGQDETLNEKTIVEESEAGIALNGLDNQMNPNMNQDGSLPSKIGDTTDACPTLPTDKAFKSPMDSRKDNSQNFPCVDVAQTSAFANLMDLDSNSVGEDLHENIAAKHCRIDRNMTSASVGNSVDDHASAACGVVRSSPDFAAVKSMEADPSGASIGDPVIDDLEFNNQKVPHHATGGFNEAIFCKKHGDVRKCDAQEGECQLMTPNIRIGDQHSEGLAMESCTVNARNPSSLVLNADHLLQLTERCNNAVVSEDDNLLKADQCQQGIKPVAKDAERVDLCPGSTQDSSIVVTEKAQQLKGVLSESSIGNAGHFTSSVGKLCSLADIVLETKKMVQMEDGHDTFGVQAVEFPPEFVATEKKILDKVNETNIVNPNVTLSMPGNVMPEKVHCTHDLLDVNLADLHISPSLHAKSFSLLGVTCDGARIVHSEVPVVEKGTEGLSANSLPIKVAAHDSQLKKKVVNVMAHVQSNSIVNDEVPGSLSEQNVVNESVSTGDVSGEVTELTSSNKLEEGNLVNDEVGEQKEVRELPSPVTNSIDLDKEETIIRITPEPSSSTLEKNSKSLLSTGPVPLSNSGKGAICKNSEEPLSASVAPSSTSVETSVPAACRKEPQVSIAMAAIQECSKGSAVCPALHGSVIEEKDKSGVLGAPEKHEVTTSHILDDATSFKESAFEPVTSSENIVSQCMVAESVSTNFSEPNCGSPIVISCSKPLQNDRKPQESGNQGSLPQSGTVSDDQTQTIPGIDRQVKHVESTSHDAKEKSASEDDKSFTFEVSSLTNLSERETINAWKPSSKISHLKVSQSGEGSPRSSDLCQTDADAQPKTPIGSLQVSDAQKVRGSTKGTGKDKSKLASSCATERGSSKHRKSAREASYTKQKTERGGKSCLQSANPVATMSNATQVQDMRQCTHLTGSTTKMSSVQIVQTSGLPDLNSSASPLTLFQQPFTDFQQVQLRAQIFVYGSLIQGTAPDETCMISAFRNGIHDDGRSTWESVWRAAVERCQNQRSPLNKPETPMPSRSGLRVPEHASRCNPLQGKAHGNPASRTGNKGTPLAVVSSMMSLPSPLWSISTPAREGLQSSNISRLPFLDSHHSLSPVHPYRSPPPQHLVANSTPWLPQASSPASWLVSHQTSVPNAAVSQYSALPVAEAVQVASIRDSSAPCTLNTQVAPPTPLVPASDVATVLAGTAVLVEATKTTTSPVKYASADQKPRKRKKSLASEQLGHSHSTTQTQEEAARSTGTARQLTTSVGIPSSAIGVTKEVSANQILSPANTGTPKQLMTSIGTSSPATGVAKQVTTSVGISSPANHVSRVCDDGAVLNSSPIVTSAPCQVVGCSDSDQRIVFPEEAHSRIEQAKLHAEDASTEAAAAVKNCQGIWSQLSLQKNSGLASEVEAKLASAAVAAAAAASVAKAAAAAAKVASDAALQAKFMADEAMAMSKMGNSVEGSENSLPDSGANMGRITPALILKGKDRTCNSSSVIVAAREAARKRVEAATAAAKRAENLDAVVRAAELVAEAVSQTGVIIAMGDPIPLSLSELIEAGSESNWKVQQAYADQLVKANSQNGEGQSSLDGVNGQLPNAKETQQTAIEGNGAALNEISGQLVESIPAQKELLKDSVTNGKGLGGQKGHKSSDLSKTTGVSPETEVELRSAFSSAQVDEYERNQQAGTEEENSIREGSHVEVGSDEVGLQGAWFSAKVQSLKDGKAHVFYSELLPDEVRTRLKEWIPLDSEGNRSPRIRIAHPMTGTKFEGTRKRRRAAVGNHVWSVGDRVDALIRDCWWEGIVKEKGKEDDTKLTIHFPAEGDTTIVRAWNLRPSLIWKDGQWIEWSRENTSKLVERDTPKQKRPKLGKHKAEVHPQVETGEKDNVPQDLSIVDSRQAEEARSLLLSVEDTVFHLGKSARDDNNSDVLKMKRTGLQKEGSRVIFGIPKPGKKRKFMEVSKHLVSDQTSKISDGTDSLKFAKYLMPQGSRGWKNASKVDFKGKRAADLKPKAVKSGKAQSIQGRAKSEKNGSIRIISASRNGTSQDLLSNAPTSSINHEENSSSSNILKAVDDALSFSSLEPGKIVPATEWSAKGLVGPPAENLTRNEEKGSNLNDNAGRSSSDVVEPRRSSRRIQPTSRLLEGLQSSLIITKIPPMSHEKGIKSQSRSMPSSRGSGRGRE